MPSDVSNGFYLHKNIALQKEVSCLLFDSGAITTMDNNCVQQVPTVAVHLQQLTTLAVRRWLCLVYNSRGLTMVVLGLQQPWSDDGCAWLTTAVV